MCVDRCVWGCVWMDAGRCVVGGSCRGCDVCG